MPELAAAVPLTIPHQGRLLTSSGEPVTGNHSVRTRLYDGSGTVLFDDTFTDVAFDDGYFTVILGSGAPLDRDDLAPTAVLLGLTLDSGAELPIRQQLHSAPYAVTAGGVTLGNVSSFPSRTLRHITPSHTCRPSLHRSVPGLLPPPRRA